MWAIDQLKPDPHNAGRQSNKHIRQIANSIKAFGFNVPMLSLVGLGTPERLGASKLIGGWSFGEIRHLAFLRKAPGRDAICMTTGAGKSDY